jgi:hypothetical protein
VFFKAWIGEISDGVDRPAPFCVHLVIALQNRRRQAEAPYLVIIAGRKPC